MEQSQFLEVIDRDEAERRFRSALDLAPLGQETVGLQEALGRVLAEDVRSQIDVPGFARSNVDGFAVCAQDTFGAAEESPRILTLNAESLATGVEPRMSVVPGTATPIATGAVVPRGADAIVMVEDSSLDSGGGAGGKVPPRLLIRHPVTPGANISQAGSDIARGEIVLRRGTVLTSRETGVLAAVGRARLEIYRRPRVAIISTGDELAAPGQPLAAGRIYDANATLLADAVRELGCEAIPSGVVPDDEKRIERLVREALDSADAVLLSGGTSKGEGDVNARVVARLPPPGIVVHGVALKPGKPLCLAVTGGKPVVILPGFPTSAIFTFHEFVAPVLRAWSGLPPARAWSRTGVLPERVNSERGRTEYLLVALVADPLSPASPPVAVPLGKGSGSVTAFAAADGFITIPRQTEYLDAAERVEVTLLGRDAQPADLVIMGSHCLGLDALIGALRDRGFTTRFLAVGSHGGLAAVAAGHADLAGIHLFDPVTGEYNRPFLRPGLKLLPGYGRLQGIVYRRGDARFEAREAGDAVRGVVATAPGGGPCVMINRNRGSGTRVLIDDLLGGARPPGYHFEARSHHAVAAAVAQGRADWGVAIEVVARLNGLGFLPLREERFDFMVAEARLGRPPVRAFAAVLAGPGVREALRVAGFNA